MKLLMLAEVGRFEDGTALSEPQRESLATAALHILRASTFAPTKSSAIDEIHILDDICGHEFGSMKTVLEKHAAPGTHDWQIPLLSGLKHLDAVASELTQNGCSSSSHDTLKQIFRMTISLYGMMLGSHTYNEEGVSHAHMVSSPSLWLNHALNYGCVHAADLAEALVWRAMIAPEISETVDAADAALQDAFSKAALQLDTPEMAHTFTGIGCQWLERAEELAARIRGAQTWTEILINSCACHILYCTAKRALGWARSTYKKLNLSVPHEVWKEHQMLEEYRADIAHFLGMYCWPTLYWPINMHPLNTLKSTVRETINTVEIRKQFIDGVYSYAGRTPHYPKALLQAWRRVAEHVSSPSDISIPKLQPIFQKEFLAVFPDKSVFQAVLNAAARFNADLIAKLSST